MAKTITITMEDSGKITVDSDEMEQPYVCESVAECRDYVDNMLAEEGGESSEEQATEKPEAYKAAWNEEAANRPKQSNMMA